MIIKRAAVPYSVPNGVMTTINIKCSRHQEAHDETVTFHLSRETCYCRSPLQFEPFHETSQRSLQESTQDTF